MASAKSDQERLRDLAARLDKDDVHVVISNSPPVWELYDDLPDFTVSYVNAARMINSDASNRGDVAEVIITNVPPEQQQQQNIQDYI